MVREVVQNYKEIGKEYDYFCLLQPTSPFRNSEDIKKAFLLMEEKKAKAIVSVCECEHSPLWSGVLNNDLCMNGFISKSAMEQRQKQDKFYRLNGAIYLLRIKDFQEGRELYTDGTYATVIEKDHSVDIDDKYDFEYAEYVAERYAKQK